MKVFEKLNVGVGYAYVTDEQLAYAQKVYGRYVGFLKKRYGANYGNDRLHTAVSLVEFLLQDVNHDRMDSFTMDEGVLVKTQDGSVGLTVGWDIVGFSHPHYAVSVKTSTGVHCYDVDSLAKANIPPEVLEYVKSTLQDKVHGKVDEAFKEAWHEEGQG